MRSHTSYPSSILLRGNVSRMVYVIILLLFLFNQIGMPLYISRAYASENTAQNSQTKEEEEDEEKDQEKKDEDKEKSSEDNKKDNDEKSDKEDKAAEKEKNDEKKQKEEEKEKKKEEHKQEEEKKEAQEEKNPEKKEESSQKEPEQAASSDTGDQNQDAVEAPKEKDPGSIPLPENDSSAPTKNENGSTQTPTTNEHSMNDPSNNQENNQEKNPLPTGTTNNPETGQPGIPENIQADVIISNNNDSTVSNTVTYNTDTGNNTIDNRDCPDTEQTNPDETTDETTSPEEANAENGNVPDCPVDNIDQSNTAEPDQNSEPDATGNPSGESDDPNAANPETSHPDSDSTSANETATDSNITSLPTNLEGLLNIITSDATTIANLVNQINTNLVGQGQYDIMNILDTLSGDINLLAAFEKIQELARLKEKTAQEDQQKNDTTYVENINDATLNNNVNVSSNTGVNAIIAAITAAANSTASITTGNALSQANLVNLVNHNIVGENWLFSMINVFGTWIGDLIVPGEDLIKTTQANQYKDLTIENKNTADIKNAINTVADSGKNIIQGIPAANQQGTILTGDTLVDQNVTTIANTNIVQNNWFFLLINNMGNWIGKVFQWSDEDQAMQEKYTYNFSERESDEEKKANGSLIVKNQNDVTVNNQLSVMANSGENGIYGTGGDSTITTGTASALAKVINFVNTNIVGDNWLFSMVNVFGTWDGNVIFAYPDLEVTITDEKDTASPGENLRYIIQVKNIGKAKSETVTLVSQIPRFHISSSEKHMQVYQAQTRNTWILSSMQPGEERSYEVSVTAPSEITTDMEITASAAIETVTKEVKFQNNFATDTTQVKIPTKPPTNPNNPTENIPDPLPVTNHQPPVNIVRTAIPTSTFVSGLSISRKDTANKALSPGELIKHSIIIENNESAPVYDVVVKDRFNKGSHNELAEYEWPIGVINPKEAVIVEYTLQINPYAPMGEYTFKANAEGTDPLGKDVKTKTATSSMVVQYALAMYYPIRNSIVPPTANAAEENFLTAANEQHSPDQTLVLGTDDETPSHEIPFWIWLSILTGYYVINTWALSEKSLSLSKKLSLTKNITIPFLSTLAAVLFWIRWGNATVIWFIVILATIFLATYASFLSHKRIRRHRPVQLTQNS